MMQLSVAALLLAAAAAPAAVDAFSSVLPPPPPRRHSSSTEIASLLPRYHRDYCSLSSAIFAEDELDGWLIGTSVYASPNLSCQTYKEDVAMYDVITTPDDEEHMLDIHLVMGPSGSGKTLFAVMDLGFEWPADKVIRDWELTKRIVRVYHDPAANDMWLVKTREHLVKRIQSALREKQQSKQPFKKLYDDMQLSVIIDEVNDGRLLDGLLQDKQNVLDLYSELQEKVASSVRLVIVCGAGETGNNLGESVYRYRMRPWGSKSVRTAIVPWKHVLWDEIERIPALNALKTNPRVAELLMKAVDRVSWFRQFRSYPEPHKLAQLTPQVFERVCQVYCAGLMGDDASRPAVVAKLVFHLLDRASNDDRGPERPVDALRDIVRNDCGGGDGDQFCAEQRLALTFVNDQVLDKDGGTLAYTIAGHNGQSYNKSVSISSALAAVCYYFIKQPLWQLFMKVDEPLSQQQLALSALYLARRSILQHCRLDNVEEGIRSTVQVTEPVPATTTSGSRTMVPVFQEPTIWINNKGGDKYANVVTEYTLLLHVDGPGMDLFGELNKIGVVKPEAVEAHVNGCCDDKEKENIQKRARLGAATTSLLYHTWEDAKLAARLSSTGGKPKLANELVAAWESSQGVGSHAYPEQLLRVQPTPLEATMTFDYQGYQMLHADVCEETPGGEAFVVKNAQLSIHEPVERRSFEKPVSVIFVTGAEALTLNHYAYDPTTAVEATTICQEQVDKNGVLLLKDDTRRLVNWLDEILKGNVVVHFLLGFV